MWNFPQEQPRGNGAANSNHSGNADSFHLSIAGSNADGNGFSTPAPSAHIMWGTTSVIGASIEPGHQRGYRHEDVEMEDSDESPKGVGNLIAQFENNINRTAPPIRKSSKNIHIPSGSSFGRTPTHPSRVTSPTGEQFPGHSRVRGGSIGRPPPVRFGSMGAGGHGGMRVSSPVTTPPAEGSSRNGGSLAQAITQFNQMHSSNMPTIKAPPTGDSLHGDAMDLSMGDFGGFDQSTTTMGGNGSLEPAAFGFGGTAGMAQELQSHSMDSYGGGFGMAGASPLVESPTSPFGAFDFPGPRMTSPIQSPSVDTFGNVDDLARSMGLSATSAHPRIGAPAQGHLQVHDQGHAHRSNSMSNSAPVPGFANINQGNTVKPSPFINTSVAMFRNLDPFKSGHHQPSPGQQQFHQLSPGAGSSSGATDDFGRLSAAPTPTIKQEPVAPSSVPTQFGSLDTVPENTPSLPSQDSYRPPLPPRKPFLHVPNQAQQGVSGVKSPTHAQPQEHQSQNHGSGQTQSGSGFTPGFNVWKPPVPTTPKPVLHGQQSTPSAFLAGKETANMATSPSRSAQSQQPLQSPQSLLKGEPSSSTSSNMVASPDPTSPPPQQTTTFSIQNPTSVALRSQQSARPTREQVPAEAWESFKPTIRRLYLEERRPLKEVIQLMASRHGFQATPKMYKTRFSQWGFVKNNTEDEVKRLLSMKFQRDAKGKVTEFVRNGRVINLSTYLKRKGVTEYDLVDFETPPDLPSYVRCRTPTPPPAPGYLRSPDLLRAQEMVVSNMRKAFLHCRQREIDEGLQVSWSDMMLWGAGSSELLFEANKQFEGEQSENVRENLIIDAFTMLEGDLKKLSPQGIKEVLFGMVHRNHGMMTALSKYLAAYSTTNLDRSHPLRQIFTTLYEVQQKHGPVTLSDLVWGCIPTIADELEAIYGRRHPYVARTWIDLSVLYNHADAERLQKLVAELQPLRRTIEVKEGANLSEDVALRYTIIQLLDAANPNSEQTRAEAKEFWETYRKAGAVHRVKGLDNTWCWHDAVKVAPWNKRCRERYGAITELMERCAEVRIKMYFEEDLHEFEHCEDEKPRTSFEKRSLGSRGSGGTAMSSTLAAIFQGLGGDPTQASSSQEPQQPRQPGSANVENTWATVMEFGHLGFGGHK